MASLDKTTKSERFREERRLHREAIARLEEQASELRRLEFLRHRAAMHAIREGSRG